MKQGVLQGSTPFLVTINNILTNPLDKNGNITALNAGDAFYVLDLSGTYVRSGQFPKTGNALYLLQSADAILTNMQTYLNPGYISYDLGTTWQQIQFWGPRGSVEEGGHLNDSEQPYTSELATLPRTFYT